MIPVLHLKPGLELSADQIVQVANGRLQLLTDDGEKVGFLLRGKIRVLFNDAITVGYLSAGESKLAWLKSSVAGVMPNKSLAYPSKSRTTAGTY
jgi:hypothetical protein